MKERPILFKGEMVRAILEGRKVMTRRVVKPQPPAGHAFAGWCAASTCVADEGKAVWAKDSGPHLRDVHRVRCPYGKPGDRLWVIQGADSWAGLSPEERFWSRVVKTEPCWEWFGRTNRKKYGYLKVGQRLWWVHRYSWQLHHGEIPVGAHVLHKCDIPWCVNPDHLYLGDNNQNVSDKVVRGRVARMPGEANGQAKLSQSAITEIRRLHLRDGLFQKDIAAKFGIGQPQVSRIVSGKRWPGGESTYPAGLLGSRILEVTEVRVERLNDISDADAIAEGCKADIRRWWQYFEYIDSPRGRHRSMREGGDPDKAPRPEWLHPEVQEYRIPAKEKFSDLWQSIHGPDSWALNPWVWVVSFKRITP